MNETDKRWRAANRARLNATQRAYYARHREEIQVRDRERSKGKEREHRRAYNMVWAAEHRDYLRAYMQEWLARPGNREKMRRWIAQATNRRRMQKRQAGGSHTIQEWEAVLEKFDNRCAYCGRGDVRLTRDHVIPIIRGGRDDIENIVPACQPCNSRKQARTVEFMHARGGGAHEQVVE